MTRLVKSTGSCSPFASMSWMRLWAASRPVSILPFSSSFWPTFQEATSSLVRVSRFTRVAYLVSGVQVTAGPSSTLGGSVLAGPEPSRWKWQWRVAAQLGTSATGRLAAQAQGQYLLHRSDRHPLADGRRRGAGQKNEPRFSSSSGFGRRADQPGSLGMVLPRRRG